MEFDEILSSYKLPEWPVDLCLDGAAAAEFELLEQKLRTANREASSLSEPSEAVQIARQLDEVATRMKTATRQFLMRAMSGTAYADLAARHPPGKDDGAATVNPHTFPIALVAASCVEPKMTEDQVRALHALITDRQFEELFTGAQLVNRATVSVPFSKLASEILQRSAQS